MNYAPKQIAPPTVAALSLDEAKAHLRLDHDDENTLVESLIKVAQAHLDGPDGVLSVVLTDSRWEESFEERGCEKVSLQQQPVRSIHSVSVDGAALSPENFSLHQKRSGRAVVEFATAQSGQIVIQYNAGAEDAASVPEPIKQAMRLHIGSLYELRETEAIGTITSKLPHYDILIGPYRRRRIG